MPLQATSGAASQDAFGGNGVAVVPAYIEDVFSCFLYTGQGTGVSQTITNNIDLSTKGGLVWLKNRTSGFYHNLFDTTRGVNKRIFSNDTLAEINTAQSLTAFNTTGFTVGDVDNGFTGSGENIVSWTFRKQPKFFDIQTWTGSGANRTISHSLGSVPACIMVKRTDTTGDWQVYHRSLANTEYLVLNSTAATATGATRWNSTTPTSTVFSLGTDASVNASAGTYVAYIFAHDAGGFGLTGTDNVISCGGFTCDGSGNATVSLGYEPQWILTKRTSSATDWQIYDNMRGFTADNVAQKALRPNTATAESGSFSYATNSTGFSLTGVGASNTFIYIAIRRGPMKVPTTGTSVFSPVTGSFSSPYTVTTNFPVDLTISGRTAGATMTVNDRLRGGTTNSYAYLNTRSTDAELTGTGAGLGFQNNTAVIDTNWQTGGDAIWWNFRRAPSFMDVVCYTGTNTYGAANHNLGVTPELVIYKSRSNAADWGVIKTVSSIAYYTGLLNTDPFTYYSNDPSVAGLFTSTQFCKYQDTSAYTYVAYLFATCAGVSKVGSYTGTGTTKQIDCGFTAGARYVLIKRTDSTGDWYVWDSARGIVAGNDPYILLNNSPQVTNTDYVDTYSAGFEISSTAPAAINANGGSFIFLAIS